ncbi:MAG: hypothetical protein ACJ8AS_09260 [Hyphomicrobiales bacterium]
MDRAAAFREITLRQIGALRLDADRPVVICDVDDVVMRSLPAFENYIAALGLEIDSGRFAVSGNIRKRATGEVLARDEIRVLRRKFLRDCILDLEPLPGAAEWLERISAEADVVMLSNMPLQLADQRHRSLMRQGMAYPLVVNFGAKGPPAVSIAGTRRAVFIDNREVHMTSVYEVLPHVHLVHFLAGETRDWRPLPFVGLTTGSWAEAGPSIIDHLRA